jgi:hypothetical protein
LREPRWPSSCDSRWLHNAATRGRGGPVRVAELISYPGINRFSTQSRCPRASRWSPYVTKPPKKDARRRNGRPRFRNYSLAAILSISVTNWRCTAWSFTAE